MSGQDVTFTSRQLASRFVRVDVIADDGYGGVTPGVNADLFRQAAREIDARQADDYVLVDVAFGGDDERSVLALYFEDDSTRSEPCT